MIRAKKMNANPTVPSMLPLVLFVACYALFVALPRHRAWTACLGGLLTVLLGPLSFRDAFSDIIQWNVVFLFFGTLILAELFMQSRMPAVLAEKLVSRTRTVRGAMLALCALTSALSAFVENVAVVLLVAPVAFSLAYKLNIKPVRLLIAIAICSNLQGTATLIGDPPSMILAGYLKMNFNDFFVYQGRPGVFFAVQLGALASLVVLWWMFRRHSEPSESLPMETPLSLVPSGFLVALIVGLALASRVDPDFRWFAGAYTCLLAGAALLWYRFGPHWNSIRDLVRTLDWDTTFFLIGVFVIVGGLSKSGWIEWTARLMGHLAGQSVFGAFLMVIVVSVTISAFVDNVPFLLAAIPIAQHMADRLLGVPSALLIFALLIGACLGGNITPIGASANVVAIGLLKREGHVVSFGEFARVGLPFTVAAVAAASAFLWYIWAP
jgi:Na+/H+ antiporter NhaD/arsenite permease-like protein